MMKFIRVVILNYNNSKYTIELTENLKKQEYTHYEIIVVDNGSKASEVNLLKLKLHNTIHCIYSDVNLGYAAGNNLGMRYVSETTPDYYFVLNNDVIINDNELLRKLLLTFNCKLERKILAVCPLIDTVATNIPLNQQMQVRRVLPTIKLFFVCCTVFKLFTRSWFNSYIYKDKMPYLSRYTESDTINGAAFMIDASFMKNNNFLDEGTFLFFEEIILGKQIIDAGGTCVLNGYTSMVHLQGMSTKSSFRKLNTKMERYKLNSELYYFKKYAEVNQLFLFCYFIFKKLEVGLKKIIY